jgi:hypothetical protein
MAGTSPAMTVVYLIESGSMRREGAPGQLGGIMNFRLSTPRRETFIVSVVIAALVVLGMIVPLPFFTGYALGLLLIAYLILLAGVLVDTL